MNTNPQPPRESQTQLDNDEKTLHVNVPRNAWVNARKAALDSRMQFKEFIAELLHTAEPMPSGGAKNPSSDSPDN